MGTRQAGVASKVNQGHPPSVYTTVINVALFPAPPGKVPENGVGLVSGGSGKRTNRFGKGMSLGTQRHEVGVGSPALWLQKNLTVERQSFGQHQQGLCHQLSELPGRPRWVGTREEG